MTTQVTVPGDRSEWNQDNLNHLGDAVVELQGIANGGSLTATGDITITSDSGATGTGDIIFKPKATERLRIKNAGDVLATPATDARAYSGSSFSWSASRAFAYGAGTRDGLFYIDTFTDASGAATPTYTKLFGGNALKTGAGNMDAFWASIDHRGAGEAGLFIGDVTATSTGAGGNLWGGHFRLGMDVAANAHALLLELIPSVSQAGKTSYGLEIQNTNDSFALTQGIRLRGNFTNPIVVYSDAAGTTTIFVMDSSGNLTTKNITSGTVSATGAIQATTTSDGATLFRFNTDRPWNFKQGGTAGSTVLRLSPEAVGKVFRITGPTGVTRSLEVTADDTAASTIVNLIPDGAGKIGFFGVTPIVKPTTTGTATGFTAGAGTAVTHLSTFTGNTGSAAYTIGDIVNALKLLGLLTA